MGDTIEITKKEYFEAKCAEIKMNMLEIWGVDNWDGYGEALNPDEGKCYSDLRDELKAELFGTAA